MQLEKGARKSLTYSLAFFAMLSIGFLSFAGMFVLSPSLFLCGGAFILAAAFEGEVYTESINKALSRLFDKNYLRIRVLREFLKKQKKDNDNIFLADYRKQKRYITDLNQYLLTLEKSLANKNKHEIEQINKKIQKAKIKKINTQYSLARMELFLLRQLENPHLNTPGTTSDTAEGLIKNDREQLTTNIYKKTWAIRISVLFALGGGICSGLATLSAMQVGLTLLGVSAVIPGGIIVTLAVFAGIGYTMLLYQAFSDMAQHFKGTLGDTFDKKKNETTIKYITRCVLTGIAVGLAIFTTIATAGTWWYAAKHGAELLKIPSLIGSTLRSITIVCMVALSAVFGITNSVSSVNRFCKSKYGTLVTHLKNEMNDAWINEGKNVGRFYNPFRILEKIIISIAKPTLFLGHLASMGSATDILPGVDPSTCVVLNAAGEGLEDIAYLPHEKNGKERESKILTLLYLPITIVSVILKCLAVLWDLPFSGNLKKSWEKMFYEKTISYEPMQPLKPNITKEWRKQEVIDVCNKTIERLADKSPEKTSAVNNIKLLKDTSSQLKISLQKLSENRNTLWKVAVPQSRRDIEVPLRNYLMSR